MMTRIRAREVAELRCVLTPISASAEAPRRASWVRYIQSGGRCFALRRRVLWNRGMVMPAPMMRVADVAQAFGLSPGKVYSMIASGELPARRFGRAWRVPAEVVERLTQCPERTVVPISGRMSEAASGTSVTTLPAGAPLQARAHAAAAKLRRFSAIS